MGKISLFGTSGIRGDAQKFLTNQFCFDLGRAFAVFLNRHRQKGPVAIGMDPRRSSPRIKEALIQGLCLEKKKVLDEGVCPIPSINYVLISSAAVGGIEVTGSHIAPHLNGIKFFAFKEEILKKHENEISRIYEQIKKRKSIRKRKMAVKKDASARDDYEEMLVKLGGQFPEWKVVVDPGNGAQSEVMSRVLRRLGLKVTAINDSSQGNFMSRDTEKEGSFQELPKKVVQEKAVLGIGYDSDGDRAAFIDHRGNFIPGDYSCSIIAKHSPGDQVVTPINTSQVVEHLGKKVIRTKVGSPYVVEAMKRQKVLFGFEGNGGGISSEIMMSRDGGSTTVKLLKILCETKKSLRQMVGELPRFSIVKDKVDCPREINPFIFKEVKQKYKGKKTESLDGLKVWLDQTTWVLFRPSSNAPEFRVFCEAKTKKKAGQILNDGLKLVKSVIKKEK